MNLDDLKQINNTKGFYVRLRKDLSKSGKIYYGGFKINQESNQKISKSFFKFNSTNIQKSLEKKKSEDLIKHHHSFSSQHTHIRYFLIGL